MDSFPAADHVTNHLTKPLRSQKHNLKKTDDVFLSPSVLMQAALRSPNMDFLLNKMSIATLFMLQNKRREQKKHDAETLG